MIKNKVTVIGLGYVGLPLAKLISSKKEYKTYGHDIDKEKIKNISISNLEVSDSPEIINDSEHIIICVPTPIKKNNQPDLKPITSAATVVSKQLQKGQKVVIESTVNPGVCEEVILPILEGSGLIGGKDFYLSHCPERVNPGDKRWNVSNIPRNVGSLTKSGNKTIAKFYRSIIAAPINEVSSIKIAESTKIIENTFRDINIAYVNELAMSFDNLDIDIMEVIKAASNKPFAFLPHFPGCGVGGHCIPVDPYYLINRAKKSGFNHRFLKMARSVNNKMPNYTIERLLQGAKLQNISKKKLFVGILGLSYKPDIADLRESPALKIINLLSKNKIRHLTYDPYFNESDCSDLKKIFEKCNSIIVVTAHKQILMNITKNSLKNSSIKVIIDGRNCIKSENIPKNISYLGIGHKI